MKPCQQSQFISCVHSKIHNSSLNYDRSECSPNVDVKEGECLFEFVHAGEEEQYYGSEPPNFLF